MKKKKTEMNIAARPRVSQSPDYLQIGKSNVKDFLLLNEVHSVEELLHGEVHDTRVFTVAQHCVSLPRSRSSVSENYANTQKSE